MFNHIHCNRSGPIANLGYNTWDMIAQMGYNFKVQKLKKIDINPH